MASELDVMVGFDDLQQLLWGLALLFYGVGDTITTAFGLRAPDTAEVGPIALVVIDWAGIWGLVGVKLAFFTVAVAIWLTLQTPSRIAIPLAIAVAGAGVTLWNSFVLFG